MSLIAVTSYLKRAARFAENWGVIMTDAELIEWLRKPYGDAVMERAADRIEALTAKLAKAVEVLEAWGDVAVHCSIEEGVCCCGDNMENHTNPMDCGHTPLDHGTYIAIQLAEKTRATLAEIKGESRE